MMYMTADQAADRMMHMSRNDLMEVVWDAYKDLYNIRPRHMINYTHKELVSWYLSFFEWNEGEQFWQFLVPYGNDMEMLSD